MQHYEIVARKKAALKRLKNGLTQSTPRLNFGDSILMVEDVLNDRDAYKLLMQNRTLLAQHSKKGNG